MLPVYSVLPPAVQRTLDIGRDVLPATPAGDDDDPDTGRDYAVCRAGTNLARARGVYLESLRSMRFDDPDRDDLIEAVDGAYCDWVAEPSFLAFEGEVDGVRDGEMLFLKASKRGNDIYNANTLQRLSGLRMVADGLVRVERPRFRLPGRGGTAHTSALFVSLTFDPKVTTTIGEAWETVGVQWNRFVTGLRRRYGGLTFIRAWEAQGNGAPHIHALLLFDRPLFDVVYWSPGEGRGRWILQSRALKDRIAARWGLGFVDVQGVVDGRDALTYILKYVRGIGKGRDAHPSPFGGPPMDRRTVSLVWIMRKRQYSISRNVDLTRRCVTQTLIAQTTLYGALIGVHKWVMVGLICLVAADDRPPPWVITSEGHAGLVRRARATLKPEGKY